MSFINQLKMRNLLVLFLAIGILSACTPKKSGESNEEKVIHDIDKLLEDLPDPSSIPFAMKSIGAEFGDSLINPLSNIAKYQGDVDKLAMNMGVYASDVSYLAAYEQSALTMEYVKACHQIGETLGDSAIYKQDLLDNIEASLGNEEELAKLLRGMIVETSIQLEKDHHLSMAALALTGGFVEELYQAVNVIENYHQANMTADEEKAKVEPLVKLVLAQEQPLLDLIALLKDIPHDDTILEMITLMNILDKLYKGELATIQEKMDADPNFVVDRDLMFGVTLEIERIRAGIVE